MRSLNAIDFWILGPSNCLQVYRYGTVGYNANQTRGILHNLQYFWFMLCLKSSDIRLWKHISAENVCWVWKISYFFFIYFMHSLPSLVCASNFIACMNFICSSCSMAGHTANCVLSLTIDKCLHSTTKTPPTAFSRRSPTLMSTRVQMCATEAKWLNVKAAATPCN